MDSPDEERLKKTIEQLTQENAKLRTQLAVAEQWNPPVDLEHAFRTARAWQCLTVPLSPERRILILISDTKPGRERQDEAAAGEVWRYLQTATSPGGRIGPFARAWMPSRLLGYLREQHGRTIIVLNRDLRHGHVSRAARMLRSNAKTRRSRLLGLSAIPLLSLCALYNGNTARSVAGLTAAVAPAATVSATITSSTSPHIETQPLPVRARPSRHLRLGNEETAQPILKPRKTSAEETAKKPASSTSPTRTAGPILTTARPAPLIPSSQRRLPRGVRPLFMASQGSAGLGVRKDHSTRRR